MTFNTTNLKRHTNGDTHIVNMIVALLSKKLPYMLKTHTSKCTSVNKRIYYMQRNCRAFDIDESIEALENTKVLTSNIMSYIELLYLVKEDLLTYDKVPDTSDVWADEDISDRNKMYTTNEQTKKKRAILIAQRKLRQLEFIRVFNNSLKQWQCNA